MYTRKRSRTAGNKEFNKLSNILTFNYFIHTFHFKVKTKGLKKKSKNY